MPLEGNREVHYPLKRAVSNKCHTEILSEWCLLILIVTAQYGQRQWDSVGGFPRGAAEIPSHLQVWRWNKYIRHEVGAARGAVMNSRPLTRYHRALLSNTYTLFFERSSLARGRAWKSSFFPPCTDFKQNVIFFLLLHLCLSVPHPVARSVNQLGPTGSCGAWEPPHLLAQGSVAPFQGWPAGPKWHSTATEVTWSILSVTTNQCPPSLPYRWDTSGYIGKMTRGLHLWYFDTGAITIIQYDTVFNTLVWKSNNI